MSVCAIVKASYNLVPNPNGLGWVVDANVRGGVCSTAFFIKPNIALTTCHGFKSDFTPNAGYEQCQYWLVGRNGRAIEIKSDQMLHYPDIDASVIIFDEPQSIIPSLPIAVNKALVGDSVYNEGHFGGGGQGLSFTVINQGLRPKLAFTRADLSKLVLDGKGEIIAIRRGFVRSKDVNLKDVHLIELSYSGREGMSGGPLRLMDTDEVIGLMSMGWPPNRKVKEQLFAVMIDEIIDRI
jgi:hypothetical protein